MGVRHGDRVAILSENRPEWAIADYACLATGVTDVPIYPNETPEAAGYIIQDSGAVAVFVSTAEQLAKVVAIRNTCPGLKYVIGFAESRMEGVDHTLAELEALGARAESPERVGAYLRGAMAVRPDDIATIIYTSGTTGKPKGVMLTHDNLYSNVLASMPAVPFAGDDTCLSFLPLSHVFERMAGHYLMMATGTSIAYAESIDSVPVNLLEVRPSLVLSVPRLYEKMYARVLENALSSGSSRSRFSSGRGGVADRWADEKLAGREPTWDALALQYRIAQKLVFSKLKANAPGGQTALLRVRRRATCQRDQQILFRGGPRHPGRGYGLHRDLAAHLRQHSGKLSHWQRGQTGGRRGSDDRPQRRNPHPGAPCDEGLLPQARSNRGSDRRGPLVPCTGDIGVLEDGFLRITDRLKDIIATAGGKKIAPQPIENEIKTSKYVSQVVMIGDKRRVSDCARGTELGTA